MENHAPISSSSCTDLLAKNSSIITGYENFHLEKDNVKLYPSKDFDFVDKHVVCLKCYQDFDSRLSYIDHVGTDICVQTYDERNSVYLKFKKRRKCRQVRKKNKNKSMEDIHSHDLKKNLLNHEILNTLQTRNKCYSDYVLSSPKKVRAKRGNDSNDEPLVKKPRGRPKKNVDAEPKKRGRPKKVNAKTADIPNNISLNNSLQNDETAFNNSLPVSCVAGSSNNKIEELKKETLSVGMKNVTEKFWKVFNTDWKHDNIEGNKKSFEQLDQIKLDLEVRKIDSSVIKDVYFNLEGLKNDLKLLQEQLLKQGKNKCYKNELESMLSKLEEKHNDFKHNELKKIDTHIDSTTDKGKENIVHCLIKHINDETQINLSEMNDNEEKCIGKWLNGDIRGNISPTISIMMNDCCEPMETIEYVDNEHFKDNLTIEYVNEEDFEEDMSIEYLNVDDLTSKDMFEDNLETLTEDMNQNDSSSVHSHLNHEDLSYIYNPILGCKICGSCFVSIAEWKMHRSEHLALENNMCKICGLKFKMYKNYIKHIKTHSKIKLESPRKKDVIHFDTHSKIKLENQNNNKPLKKYKCKVCSKSYNCLKSYYTHVKTHKNS